MRLRALVVLGWVGDRLEALMVVLAVLLFAWAAFDVSPIAGRVVAGMGLLYLGGGLGKLIKELRGG